MAVDVVEFLEAIQIDADDRQFGAVAMRAGQFAAKMLVETRAIGQAGQAVVEGQTANAFERIGPRSYSSPRRSRRR